VRLVGPNGEQVGIVRVEDALRLAAEADLDLVEVAPMAKPPVAKLMDFGKFKYEAALKAREARKNQVNTVIKEIKLRPKIDPHDYETKKGHVVRFLSAGDKVKVTIMFRGREQSRPELGFRLLQRLAEDVIELGFVESQAKQDGRNMIMVLGPTKKKAEAKAEQRKRRDQAEASSAAARPVRPGEVEQDQPDLQAAPVEPVVDAAPVEQVVDAAPVEPVVEAAPVEPTLKAEPVVEAAPVEPTVEAEPVVEAAPVEPTVDAEPAVEAAPAPAAPRAPRAPKVPAATAKPAAAAEQPADASAKPAPAKSAPVPGPPKPRPVAPKDTPKPRPGSAPVPGPPRPRAKA